MSLVSQTSLLLGRLRPLNRQHGFSLVELMVSMVIGLVTVLMVSKTAMLWEDRKRTTTDAGSAVVDGALALQTITRDIEHAGYGALMSGQVGCWARIRARANGNIENFQLAPVIITRGANGMPDTIRVLLSDSTTFAAPVGLRENHNIGDERFVVPEGSNLGIKAGDLMLAIPQDNCDDDFAQANLTNYATFFNVSDAPNGTTIPAATDNRGPWNHPAQSRLIPDLNGAGLGYASGSTLVNMGRLESKRGVPLYREYSLAADANGEPTRLIARTVVAKGSLRSGTETWRTEARLETRVDRVAAQIVQLQAIYGRDTSVPPDGSVDTWDSDTPNTSAGWKRVKAIRLAIVARVLKTEKEQVTDSKPVDPNSSDGGDCRGASMDSNYPLWRANTVDIRCLNLNHLDDRQNYRYQVYETTVPLKNNVLNN